MKTILDEMADILDSPQVLPEGYMFLIGGLDPTSDENTITLNPYNGFSNFWLPESSFSNFQIGVYNTDMEQAGIAAEKLRKYFSHINNRDCTSHRLLYCRSNHPNWVGTVQGAKNKSFHFFSLKLETRFVEKG